MKVNVLGTGYVGLVSGVCLAAKGHKVKCFDTSMQTISSLRNGKSHFYENGLEKLLEDFADNLSYEFLEPETEAHLLDCQLILIAVGTPTVNETIDLSQIRAATELIGRLIRGHDKFISVVVKSTVVPGTTDTFVKNILEEASGKKLGDFGLGMNPEFLREGNAIVDFMYPDRIVFGYEDARTLELLTELYDAWSGVEKIRVNTRSAEMIKYVNNSLLATQISTINEYSNIAKAIGGIDFTTVMKAVHLDKRWSPVSEDGIRVYPQIIDYLKPGCGFGGSCFPKDVMALAAISKEFGVNPRILDSVIEVNNIQPHAILKYLESRIGSFKGRRFLVLGLAFKPDTDDVRESVSIKIIGSLHSKGAVISAHDPISIENAKRAVNCKVDFVEDWVQAIKEVEVVIIATNWAEYKDLVNYEEALDDVILFDTRSLFTSDQFKRLEYININD